MAAAISSIQHNWYSVAGRLNAVVVKLVDTLASGASSRKGLGVRVSPAALGNC